MGVVTADGAGTPTLEGVTVTATRTGVVGTTTTSTGADGTYALDLPAGSYHVCFSLDAGQAGAGAHGYVRECHDGLPAAFGQLPPSPITLAVGGTRTIDAALAVAGSLTISVAGDADSVSPGPTALAEVYVAPVGNADGNLVRVATETGVPGTYEVHGLTGNVTVCAIPPSGSQLRAGCFGGRTADVADSVPITSGMTAMPSAIVLTSAALITGTVVQADGTTPAVGVDVYALDRADPFGQTFAAMPTAADGSFAIDGLRASTYVVCTTTDQDGLVQPNCIGGTATPTEFTVTVGEVRPVGTITVQPGLPIFGPLVTTSGPVPAYDILAIAYDADTKTFADAAYNYDNGAFRLRGLDPAREYFVCFRTANMTEYVPSCIGSTWDGSNEDSVPPTATRITPSLVAQAEVVLEVAVTP